MPGRPPEGDHRGRDAAAGALHQDRRARLHVGLGEEHAVRRQPAGRQARGLLERSGRPAWAPGCAGAPAPGRPACRRTSRTAACAAGRASRRRGSRGRRRSRARRPRCRPRRGRPRRSRAPSAAGPPARPTPCRLHRSWWFSDEARSRTVVHPSRGAGSACSPTTRGRPAGRRCRSGRRRQRACARPYPASTARHPGGVRHAGSGELAQRSALPVRRLGGAQPGDHDVQHRHRDLGVVVDQVGERPLADRRTCARPSRAGAHLGRPRQPVDQRELAEVLARPQLGRAACRRREPRQTPSARRASRRRGARTTGSR